MVDSEFTHSPEEFVRISQQVASLGIRRWRAEVEVLATIIPIGGWGLTLASMAGLDGPASFSSEDTRAIYAGFGYAIHTGRKTKEQQAVLIVESLKIAKCWDIAETRPFVASMTWGPESLARLFYAMAAADCEKWVGAAIDNLRQVIDAIEQCAARVRTLESAG